jgi:DNA-directed RNA polymerase sigma subunit (sigma70/sigma32)
MKPVTAKTQAMVKVWQSTNDNTLKKKMENEIVKANMDFIWRVAGFYRGKHGVGEWELEEIRNECAMTILKALETYDPTRGTLFISHWVYKMRGATGLYMYWKDKFNVERKDSQIKGPEAETIGVYGIINYRSSKDTAKHVSFEEIVDNDVLNDLEKQLLINHYQNDFDLETLGNSIGYSREYARQILVEARRKLKQEFTRSDHWKKYSLQYS